MIHILQSKKLKKLLFIGFPAIFLIVLIYVLFQFFSQPAALPEDFLQARQEAARLSQGIVELTKATNETIEVINLLEAEGNSQEAIVLISKARQNNQKSYEQAFELSQQLKKLTESLSQIQSRESQNLAYQAVSLELGLISEFISYTKRLNDFFDNLHKAILTNTFSDRRAVENSLVNVNQKVTIINDLNQEFLVKMEALDRSL